MTPPAQDTAVKVGIGAANIAVQANADGSVVVNLDTRRKVNQATDYAPELYEANLLDSLSNSSISSIQSELEEGIKADIDSRREAIDNYNNGLEMLGLRLEDRGVSDKTSKVRHPLLLWAIIKFQANAHGEMLPSDGPAKIQDYGNVDPARAEHLEQRFNWYLTKKATEYYPDTDRALFYIGYGGTVHKKVYRCPRRNRPVSETVYFPDLIISNDTTDIENAARVTHQINGVTKSQMLQLMDSGFFSDLPLTQPQPDPTSSQRAEATVVGVKAAPVRSQDYTHTLWECTTWLDLGKYGLAEKGAPKDIPLPYTVTMDKDSHQLFRVCRAWNRPQPNKPTRPIDYLSKQKVFFKWGMIPGIGYSDLGFLHLLGNHTRALTALERILIDAGIFSNFPGGVRSQDSRMETNVIMAGPGEFPAIDTGNATRIQDAIMALPFKGPTSEVLSLLQELQKQGETVAGVIDITTGEGRKDIPVGTMLASIEQQTQVITGVHRRLHTAQGEELTALRDLLADQPELLNDPDAPEEDNITGDELRSSQLVPVSDPNIPAHVHRLMQAVALDQLQQEHPQIFNEYTVVSRLLDIGHVNDKQELLIPIEVFHMQQQLQQQAMQQAAQDQQGAAGPDPQTTIAVKQIDAQSSEKIAAIKTQADAQGKALDVQSQEKMAAAKVAASVQSDQAKTASAEKIKQMELTATDQRSSREEEQKIAEAEATRQQQATETDLDRQSREDIAAMNDQTQLILKDKEVAGAPTEGKEAKDKKKGP